ncbi:MAG: SdrD B-like domain-containing protein, partial [Ilumatobacteraceae bacterium]
TEKERRATVVGVQSDYLHDTDGFTECRVRDVSAGRDVEAAIGLRNRWEVLPGVGLHTSLERVQTLSGAIDGDATAAAFAVSYTAQPDWKGTGRIEYRIGEVQDTLLSTLGLAAKIDTNWSVLGRTLLERASRDASLGDDLLGRFQIGMAYRPTDDNRWNALGRYEYRFEKNVDFGYRQRRNVHIVSFHGDLRHSSRLWTTGRYAVKWVDEDSLDIGSSGLTQLLSGRVTYDLAKRWDAGLVMGALAGDGTRSLEYALGAEVGYLIAKNFWLSGGFNVAGFEDRDLEGQNYTRPGPYLRIRFKFDEGALGWLEGDRP